MTYFKVSFCSTFFGFNVFIDFINAGNFDLSSSPVKVTTPWLTVAVTVG